MAVLILIAACAYSALILFIPFYRAERRRYRELTAAYLELGRVEREQREYAERLRQQVNRLDKECERLKALRPIRLPMFVYDEYGALKGIWPD